MEGQPETAPLLWYAVGEGRRSPPFRSDFCGFLALWGMGVEENRGVAFFLYSFFGKTGEGVEENRGGRDFPLQFL